MKGKRSYEPVNNQPITKYFKPSNFPPNPNEPKHRKVPPLNPERSHSKVNSQQDKTIEEEQCDQASQILIDKRRN